MHATTKYGEHYFCSQILRLSEAFKSLCFKVQSSIDHLFKKHNSFSINKPVYVFKL
jgi:hypothetical protein